MRITAALLKAWKRDGQDRTLRSMIVNSEWEELCDLAIKGLASPPEALREGKVPEVSAGGTEKLYVGRFAAKFLTIHVDPSLPDDVIEIRAPYSEHVLARIVNVALSSRSEGDGK
jgi:hypothetical protein